MARHVVLTRGASPPLDAVKRNGVTRPIVVLGLGNILLRDDGVGVHAVRNLIGDGLDGCVLIEVGTAVLGILDSLDDAVEVIALDAVESGHAPGTIVRFELDGRVTTTATSLHDLGLAGVLRSIPAASRPRVIVLGIEPQRIEIGTGLSEVVADALPRLVEATRREVERIRRERCSLVAGQSTTPLS